MTSTAEVRHIVLDFYLRNGFSKCDGTGLLSDIFPHTFTPSVGHPEAILAVNSEPIPILQCAIQDICFRAIDLNRVGFGPHLSLFEMSVSLRITDFTRDHCIREIQWAFEILSKVLGVDPRRLYVTTFPGTEVYGVNVEADDWSAIAWQEMGVPSKNIVRAPGEACILIPESANEPAGIRSEVFYKPAKSEAAFEIATLEFLRYKTVSMKGARSLRALPDGLGLLATAFGIERLILAVDGLESIFDVQDLRALVESIARSVGYPSYHQLNPYPYRILADAFRASSAIIQSGQVQDNSRRGQILRNVIGRLRRMSSELGVPCREIIAALLPDSDRTNPWANKLLDLL